MPRSGCMKPIRVGLDMVYSGYSRSTAAGSARKAVSAVARFDVLEAHTLNSSNAGYCERQA